MDGLHFLKKGGTKSSTKIRKSRDWATRTIGKISNNCNQLLITYSIPVNITLTINKQKHLSQAIFPLELHRNQQLPHLIFSNIEMPCLIRSAAENGAFGPPPVKDLNHSKPYWVTVHLQRKAPVIKISSKRK